MIKSRHTTVGRRAGNIFKLGVYYRAHRDRLQASECRRLADVPHVLASGRYPLTRGEASPVIKHLSVECLELNIKRHILSMFQRSVKVLLLFLTSVQRDWISSSFILTASNINSYTMCHVEWIWSIQHHECVTLRSRNAVWKTGAGNGIIVSAVTGSLWIKCLSA